ncbi:MAG: response regulator transcription factor [Nitrospinales bacterium]
MSSKKILLVEDERNISKGLMFNLQREGYEIDLAENGESALECFSNGNYDLMILDIMLPKLGGLEVARKVRETNIRFPILMLTAKTTDEDRALGFELGADDYITKPFHLPELLLRVKGMLRRWEWYKEPVRNTEKFKFGKMWINFDTGKAKGNSGEFHLTSKETLVMNLLASKKDEVVSREELLEKVWGYTSDTETRTIDNFIARLRKYFEKNPRKPEYIITVREKGYQLVSNPEKK